MKTILMGIGVASILMFGGLLLGIVDPGHLSVKAAYGSVFIGGLLLGLGFAVAGYCPGTGLTAMATGRIDALMFLIGGLVGAGVYMLTYGSITGTPLLDNIAGGEATLVVAICSSLVMAGAEALRVPVEIHDYIELRRIR